MLSAIMHRCRNRSGHSRLPLQQAEEVNEWLEQWLEDQRELSPEFAASLERGKDDLAARRWRVVRL